MPTVRFQPSPHGRRRPAAAVAALLLAAACGDGVAPDPAVSNVGVSPADTVLLPGDTLRLTATAYDPGDTELPDVPLSWSSSAPAVVEVGPTGLAHALAEGEAVLEAVAPGGARGSARVRVRALAGFEPGHGAFGEIVTVRGRDLGGATRVRFGDTDATVRAITEDGRTLEAWVPLGARTGRIEITAGGRTITTEGPFYVTGGGDDALEPNGFDAPRAVPFPFGNPALVTRPPYTDSEVDAYRIRLDAPGPFRAALTDASLLRDRLHAVRMELVDVAAQDLLGLVASWSALTDEEIRPVGIDIPHLPAGTYDLRITPFGFSAYSTLVPGDRGYGLTLDTLPRWELPRDSLEPDDYPPLATAVPFPFEGRFRIENPYGADYFRFSIDATTDTWVVTSPAVRTGVEEDVDLFLMSAPTKAVQWVVATGEFPDIYHASVAFESSEAIFVRLPPGEYVVGVLDRAGAPATYDLWLGSDADGGPPDNVSHPAFRLHGASPAPARPASHTADALRSDGKLWPACRC